MIEIHKQIVNLKKFFKDEQSKNFNPKDIIENSKNIITAGLVISSIGCFSPEKIIAIDTTKQLKNTTLVEDMYSIDYWNEDLSSSKLLNVDNNQNFIKINIPLIPNDKNIKDENYIPGNTQRDIFYDIKYLPGFVVNGKKDTSQESSTKNSINLILDGIKNQKNYANLSIKDNGDNTTELTITGIDEKLKNHKNTNVTVLLVENWANCDFTFKEWMKEHKTSLQNIVREYPLGPIGTKINLKKDDVVTIRIDSHIPQEKRNNYKLIVIIQDIISKEVVSAGVTSLANTDTPTIFNWNNWPKNFFMGIPDEEAIKYTKQIGLGEMTFIVKNANDLKYLSFEIAQNDWDKERYDILATKIKEDVNVDKIKFNPETNHVTVVFKNPINGDKELFSFITYFKKYEELKISSSYKIGKFEALNSKYESIYFDITNDIKRLYPAQLIISNNPLDLNKNTWINEEDLNLLIKTFGTQEGDEDWKPEYDIYKNGFSKNRIDICDLFMMIKGINEQNKLLDIVKKQNPNALKNIQKPNHQTELRQKNIKEWQKFEARQVRKTQYLRVK